MTLAAEWDDLDRDLCGDEPEYDNTPEPPAAAETADRYLRRLHRTRRQIDEVHEIAAAERARIDTWETGRLEQLAKATGWLEQILVGYHRAVLTRNPEQKSIDLPYGTLRSVRQPPEWTIDPDVFLPWASVNRPELVNPGAPKPAVVTPDRAAIKKALSIPGKPVVGSTVTPVDADGEVPPGVTVLIREPRFTIDTGADR